MNTDDDRIRRAKSGDAEAWRELYTAHAGRLVAWLRALPTGDSSVAPEDLGADAWLTAAARIADFQGTSDEFAGWLFGIGRNHLLNARRRSARRATSPAEVDLLDALAPSTPADESVDGRGWVTWMLSHLTEREREVVACIDVVGLDVAATATALDMSPTAVRVARHRGLRRLRGLGLVRHSPDAVGVLG